MTTLPALTVVVPVKVLALERVKSLAPVFVKAPAPVMLPPMVKALPLVLMVPAPVMVTRRVEGEVKAPSVRRVPPLKIRLLVAEPSPRLADEVTTKVPLGRVVGPL